MMSIGGWFQIASWYELEIVLQFERWGVIVMSGIGIIVVVVKGTVGHDSEVI